MSESNEAVVRRLIAALQDRNVAALAETLADDVVYHFPGRSVMAGTYRGRETVLAAGGRLAGLLGAPPALEVHDVTSSPDHVVELSTHSAARNGRPFEWRVLRVYHVRNGRIAEIWLVPEDVYALDEYLG